MDRTLDEDQACPAQTSLSGRAFREGTRRQTSPCWPVWTPRMKTCPVESDEQVTGFVNSSYANVRSAVAMALAYLIDPETPKNDGTFRPLTVVAREGTVVWARSPAPVTLCTNHCGQEIGEAIIKALARACPERAMAGWGRRFRIAIHGKNPKTGQPFLWHLFHARPGGGASAAGDGWPSAGEWQAAGGIKFGSVEVMET